MPKLQLKILLFILSACLINLACSTKKYPYYFNSYSLKSASSSYDTILNSTTPSGNVASDYSTCSSVPKQNLSASISKEFHSVKNQKVLNMGTDISLSLSPILDNSKVDELDLGKKKTKRDDTKKGDKRKNGFAIAGFVTSIIGMIMILAIPPPLLMIGVILSAIGLKSEKRGLAKAGMIIGIVGVTLWLLFLLGEIFIVTE